MLTQEDMSVTGGPQKPQAPQAPTTQIKPPASPTTAPIPTGPGALQPMTPPAPQPATPAPAAAPTMTPPAAMTPPAPSAAAPMTPPAIGSVTTSQFGPGNDLRGTQITPTETPRLGGVRAMVDAQANKLGNGPDRFGLATDRFKTYAEQTDPAFQASIRAATQKAAANGAIGSGMLTTDYGNLDLARERDLRGERDTLFNTALEGTIGDTRANVGLLSGLEGQQVGQGVQDRNELRNERGYQNGMETQAYDRGIQGITLEDALTNSQFGRSLATNQAGQAGSPVGTQLALSGIYGKQAEDAGNALSGLINSSTQNGILSSIYGGNGPSTSGTTAIRPGDVVGGPVGSPNIMDILKNVNNAPTAPGAGVY